jgi:hypothetical protein
MDVSLTHFSLSPVSTELLRPAGFYQSFSVNSEDKRPDFLIYPELKVQAS